MAINKIVYFGETLIDLTGDTVTEETLLTGRTAHLPDGTIVKGVFFEGFPAEQVVTDFAYDNDGAEIYDSEGTNLEAQAFYVKRG